MTERVALLTGSLAEPRLAKIAAALRDDRLDPVVINIGVKVAALMTAEIVERRLHLPERVDRVVMPGRFRGNLDRLSLRFGLPFVRGPDEAADLPDFFARTGRSADLSRHDVTIFAEIVDAPRLAIGDLLARAHAYRADGADVIDLGAVPGEAFDHIEAAIAALKAEGFAVSIDSFDPSELARGAQAGADYLLSLTEDTLAIGLGTPAVPVLVPARPGDLASLVRAVEACRKANRRFLADPILDPIHFGFTASLQRYAELRRLLPDAPILMGIGNLTELTDADTTGMTALLMGIVSELRLNAVLAVEVSPHCRSAVRECDRARREFYAAREAGALPQGFGGGLMALRDRKPHAASDADVRRLAASVRDANYRIAVTAEGIHAFNRDGHHLAADPFALFPHLEVEGDAAHAFYLGVETARAEIAHRLGKRYAQDEALDWGVAGGPAPPEPDRHRLAFKAAGPTLSPRPGPDAEDEA
ncbi:DUF6513 domain-containing protein [Aquabacter spiritensis]|uniref:Dihydropteroate synthase-like protein n=1 Tax=Aquabacter spiritensis TaxID=933073 RepID=A0A4R3LVA5_9HYPH|nr:DUF6513 domain-containing protein [Aquabacter spiritensis]TCT02605.1 dihydropteroate synthase-like protein [Aquabacter spiritensis]